MQDSMFDKQLQTQLQDLPDLQMPACLKNIKLFDFQVQGIQFLVQKELSPKPPPFFKTVQEQRKTMYLCEITQSSQSKAPSNICGSILCDAMGLGKSIQTLGLILLAPRPGVEYNVPNSPAIREEEDQAPCPPVERIRTATCATLKQILKQANLKITGKKSVLLERVLENISSQTLTGEHFSSSMPSIRYTNHAPASVTTNAKRCTLIVCPVSVMATWTQQVQDHVQEGVLNLKLYLGPNRRAVLEQVQQDDNVDILLVSYHTLAADFGAAFDTNKGQQPMRKKTKRESIFDIHFHRIVLDEAVCRMVL
jgi:SNF2 family DNA or RNA helicase